jgi:hypothetical protein
LDRAGFGKIPAADTANGDDFVTNRGYVPGELGIYGNGSQKGRRLVA